MSKVIRLTESDIEKVVSGVIKQKNTQELKSTNTLMVEIDSMLDFHYRSNSAFLKHIEDFSERFNILQDVKNLVENLFSNDNIILERFNKFSNKGVIVESTFNFQEELNGYFKFSKASLLYQGGFITESQYNKYDLLVEDWWDDVKSGVSSVGNAVVSGVKTAGNAVASGVKTVGKAVVSGAKTVGKAVVSGAKTVGNAVVTGVKAGYAALQGAWNKLKSLGVSTFMDNYRAVLTSNWGAALQILIEVSTEGFGAVVPLIAWAILANYDIANIIAGTPNWFNTLFSLIGTATTGIASKAIGAAMPFFKSAGKASSSIMQAIEWLAKSKFGQFFKPMVTRISAGLGRVPGLIAKAMTWVKGIFGKVFGEGIVAFFTKGANAVGKFIGELGTGLKNFFTPVVKNAKVLKGGVDKFGKKIIKPIIKAPKKLVNTVVKGALQKGANLSPKLATYLATASGKTLSKKLAIQTVNTIKKELTSKLKTYSEDQAIAYVEKTYGKPYADLLKNSKAAYEVGHGSHEIATNVKDWKKAGQNLANSGNWSGEQYKNVVSNTQKVVKAGDELINGEPKPLTVSQVANTKPVA
jgi:uncharacterized protein YqgV (UPF0045/DUF77 family)